MKKIIFLIVALIVLSCSTIYAKLYNPSEGHAFDENLPFIDLQEKVLDRGGSQKRNKEGVLLFSYHKYINEILKANTITIDVKGNKLIEGYANVKEGTSKYDGTYSFKPNDPVSKGEFIKMAICLSNNRSFDYSIFTIPDSLKSHWAAPYVVVAEMQDVIEQGDINEYNIDEPTTRLDMIKILSRIQINMKGIPQYRDGVLPNYSDIGMLTEKDKAYLLHATKYDLIEGMTKSENNVLEIKPDLNITRGEAVRALLRVY